MSFAWIYMIFVLLDSENFYFHPMVWLYKHAPVYML